ncbi:acyl-CoA thioesterase [Mucilaginibacter antarcticus]|uniref:Acyl-CoA thioesterase n=1 Tax=Mucilaginibacter antarcticus TaxID=1855725 RepID=A0ABW5XPZ3_9SPHI
MSAATDTSGYKTVRFSETTITELMIPSYSNFGGKIHGGVLLSLMDKVAYVCAAKHAGNYCVTASIDTVDFLQPVEVGDLVSLMASVNYVGNTSLVVGIKVISENIKTNTVKHTNTSYFSMVAKDDDNTAVQVPGLILENGLQVRRFVEAKRRKEIKQAYKQQVNKIEVPASFEECENILTGEKVLLINN